jgi:hypothetical protein
MYLKNKGVITADQLVAALEVQMRTLVPIGQIALEEGILSVRQVREILSAQSGLPRVRFGELAVEMRLMKRHDVSRLLMIQDERKHPIAEILLAQGAITPSQLAAEYAAYRRAQVGPKDVTTTIIPAPRSKETARSVSPVAAV